MKREIEGFVLEGDRLNVEEEDAFKKEPRRLLQMFQLAQKHDVDLHPAALRLVTQNLDLIDETLQNDPEANRLFTEILVGPNPKVALMRLNEAGVSGRFLPACGPVRAPDPDRMYLAFPV